MIENDSNGPFIRAVREAGAPQTETIHAVRVRYQNGEIEYWDPRVRPYKQQEVNETRQSAYRHSLRGRGRVMEVDTVSRNVTISATDWVEETPKGT